MTSDQVAAVSGANSGFALDGCFSSSLVGDVFVALLLAVGVWALARAYVGWAEGTASPSASSSRPRCDFRSRCTSLLTVFSFSLDAKRIPPLTFRFISTRFARLAGLPRPSPLISASPVADSCRPGLPTIEEPVRGAPAAASMEDRCAILRYDIVMLVALLWSPRCSLASATTTYKHLFGDSHGAQDWASVRFDGTRIRRDPQTGRCRREQSGELRG